MIFQQLTMTNSEAWFNKLQDWAYNWLLDGNLGSLWNFRMWISSTPVFVIEIPEGIILVTNWKLGLSAEIHGLIRDWKKARNKLPSIFRNLFEILKVGRLEFRLKWPSRTLKKYLSMSGARHEGTARKADFSYSSGNPVLIDVDIWAILCQDLEVSYGVKP